MLLNIDEVVLLHKLLLTKKPRSVEEEELLRRLDDELIRDWHDVTRRQAVERDKLPAYRGAGGHAQG
jgi:hypothetical protein